MIRRLLRRLVAPYVASGVRRAEKLLAGEVILRLDRIATSFGIESAGNFQLRGSGCLAASADRLAFSLWRPRRDLVIERRAITAVETPRSHLGKSSRLRPLLRVRYVRPDGAADAIAWDVAELSPWVELLTGRPAASQTSTQAADFSAGSGTSSR